MELKKLGITPVSAAAPAGTDIRSEETFDKLSTEIEKMSSPSAAGALDWQKVLDMCSDILNARSKDLLVAAYLSMALMKTDGLRGLATGVHVWRDMLATYWETLFPAKSRIRGRRNAIDWWLQKSSSTVTAFQPEVWQEDAIAGLYDDLNAIDAFFQENMEDPPTVGPLMSIIGSVISSEQAPAESQAAAPKPSAPPPTTAPNVAAVEPAPDGDDPEPFIKHGLESLRAVSNILMQKGVVDGLYFRINRAVAWMTVSAAPPNHGGRTMIESPDEEIRDSLRSMYQSGSWKNLLAACESRIGQYLFWLDLSRFVAEALEQTGQTNVAAEVTGETALYVKRLPGIERLTFSDGTPFADPATRRWLSDAAGGAGSPTQGTSDSALAQAEQDMDKTRALAAGGNLPGAIAQLRDGLRGASSVRERFLRQVRLCRFLLENNQGRVSGAYFHELLRLIDTYRLAEWEPSLATEAYEVILTGIASMKESGENEMRSDVFRRLSVLDPVRALDYT